MIREDQAAGTRLEESKSRATRLFRYAALLTFAAGFFGASPARAQLGNVRDPDGVQELRVPRELIPPAPVLQPEDALKSFVLEAGLRIELVAAEPLVEDPVQIAFDPDGALWAVELRGYMHTVDGGAEDQPIGRVVKLEDTDGDGRMDRSTVFMDKLIMPRSITHVAGGLLVGAPPHLWFCRDTDGDGRADSIVTVADDFGVAGDPKRPEIGNPELAPNHLLWGLDNWIHAGYYEARFHWNGTAWERKAAPLRGRWGLTQDDWGRQYYNNSTDEVRGTLAPSHYFERNKHYTQWAPLHYGVTRDQRVWPARVNPGVNRGYQSGVLRDYRLASYTAACAPTIFRGHLFPQEYYGNVFVAEPAGNLVKRILLTENDDGTVTGKFAYEGREFLASTDERFRPVDIATGPDGALYVADLYRGILQNRNSLTTYLRNQILERGLERPLGLGRIYRVVPVKSAAPAAPTRPRFSAEAPLEWVQHLSHPNGWWRETAQRLLVEKRAQSTLGPLRRLALSGADPRARIHALWTLDGMGSLDFETLAAAGRDPHAKVRIQGVRLNESWLNGPRRTVARAAIIRAAEDTSAEVRQQAALSLGEIRDDAARGALAALATRYSDDAFLVDNALTGLSGHEFAILESLLEKPPETGAQRSERFARRLVTGVMATPETLQHLGLFARIADPKTPAAVAQLLLAGTHAGIARLPSRRLELPAPPTALLALITGANTELRKPTIRLVESLRWPGKADAPLPARALTSSERLAYREGQVLYAQTCVACHQNDGKGLTGVAPPLAGSEWVTGSTSRLARILLHGLGGPIEVAGKTFNLDMPAFGALKDDQIASVITFIRRSWGHEADPVAPEFITRIRKENSDRQLPWRAAELNSSK